MIAPPTNALFLHELELRLTLRKQARQARAQAARQGHSNEWKRRGQKCREVFG